MPAAQPCPTMAANGINFVDEDDAGGVLFPLLKQIADTASTNAHKHLHKIRTGDAEERNIGFTGNRAGQQGLAGSRMTYKQDALRNASTELLKLLRFTQEFDDLPQLFLGFVYSSYIFEGNFFLLHGEQAGAALAKTQSF